MALRDSIHHKLIEFPLCQYLNDSFEIIIQFWARVIFTRLNLILIDLFNDFDIHLISSLIICIEFFLWFAEKKMIGNRGLKRPNDNDS